MSVLVSDTSVIIDLERGGILEQLFQLPYEICVPDLLFERELKGELGDRLLACGLDVVELDSEEMTSATQLNREHGRLSAPDTFAFILAQARQWTLLTGDGPLRRLAIDQGVQMHGVLWVIDQYRHHGIMEGGLLHGSLTAISEHQRCRLPTAEVQRLLAKLID